MRKLFLVSFILIGLFLNKAHSEEIKSIEINGNNRISDETILVFSGVKLNNSTDTFAYFAFAAEPLVAIIGAGVPATAV